MEIVPGVVGPERIVADNVSVPVLTTGTVDVRMDIRFDRELRRYICHELTVCRSVVGTPAGPVTTEVLRKITVEHLIKLYVLVNYPDEPPTTWELDNPDGREPWGYTAPDGLTDYGPTDRVLQWVAHFYRLGYATSYGAATKSVQDSLKVPRSTAGRWISMARQKGYLGPAEGRGKAGG